MTAAKIAGMTTAPPPTRRGGDSINGFQTGRSTAAGRDDIVA